MDTRTAYHIGEDDQDTFPKTRAGQLELLRKAGITRLRVGANGIRRWGESPFRPLEQCTEQQVYAVAREKYGQAKRVRQLHRAEEAARDYHARLCGMNNILDEERGYHSISELERMAGID